jgi:hypothetical protein
VYHGKTSIFDGKVRLYLMGERTLCFAPTLLSGQVVNVLWKEEIFIVKTSDQKEQVLQGSYLVDPASSHMLVSKIKPCMSKYNLLILRNCEWLIKSVIVYLMVLTTRITVVILELIRA